MMVAQHQAKSLLSLPPEILTIILLQLIPSSIDSVQATLYVCKELYHIALPLSVHTYRMIHLESHVKNFPTIVKHTARRPNLAFLRYITETKPFLASCVKKLVFDKFSIHLQGSNEFPPPQPEKLSSACRDNYRALLQRGFIHIAVEGAHGLVELALHDLEVGFEEPEILLLLTVCHCLEELHFAEGYHSGHLRCFIQSAVYGARVAKNSGLSIKQLPLNNLHSLYHESEDLRHSSQKFADRTPLIFSLPNITSYECVLACSREEINETIGFSKLPHGASTIEHISLLRAAISPPVMRDMIAACASLRSLQYNQWIDKRSDYLGVTPSEILEAVLPHAKTMEFLDLDYDPSWLSGPQPHTPTANIYMGTKVSCLHALKTLKVGAWLFMGYRNDIPYRHGPSLRLVECLPPNLEHLEIYECGTRDLRQLQELFDAFSDSDCGLSRLNFIRCFFNVDLLGSERIRLTCSAENVHIELVCQDWQRKYGRESTIMCTRIEKGVREDCVALNASGIRVALSDRAAPI